VQKSQFLVIEEAPIATTWSTLKTDLVVEHQRRFQVVDFTVRHQDTGYLEERHNSKVENANQYFHSWRLNWNSCLTRCYL